MNDSGEVFHLALGFGVLSSEFECLWATRGPPSVLAHPGAGPADPAVAIRAVSSASAAWLPKSPGPGALSSSLPGQGPPCHRCATAIPLCVFLKPPNQGLLPARRMLMRPGAASAPWELASSLLLVCLQPPLLFHSPLDGRRSSGGRRGLRIQRSTGGVVAKHSPHACAS